jgi:hypothetical protein
VLWYIFLHIPNFIEFTFFFLSSLTNLKQPLSLNESHYLTPPSPFKHQPICLFWSWRHFLIVLRDIKLQSTTPNYRYEVLEHKRTKKLKWKKEKKTHSKLFRVFEIQCVVALLNQLRKKQKKKTTTTTLKPVNIDLFSGCNFNKDQAR